MLVLCLLEYLKLNSRRERGESHFFIFGSVYGVVEADEVFLTPTKKLYELIKDFKIRQQICK